MSITLEATFPQAVDQDGRFSLDLYKERSRQFTAAAKDVAEVSSRGVVEHRSLILVDLQGLYLALVNWFAEQKIPLESGLPLSEFAICSLSSVVRSVEQRMMAKSGGPIITFSELVRSVTRNEVPTALPEQEVLKLEPSIELFYAPAPLNEIEWQLRKRARQGSWQAKEQLAGLSAGLVSLPGGERDYRFYEDFVTCLKKSPFVTRSEHGFFNFYVGARGLQFIDEKEVDIRIAIRAVDACYDSTADSVCIVSSDQDFVPLHERCQRAGLTSFQADAAKFMQPERVGRRIRELGTSYIPTPMEPDWPLRVIIGSIAPFARYQLSFDELEGLCRAHNAINDVELHPQLLDNGNAGLVMHRPIR